MGEFIDDTRSRALQSNSCSKGPQPNDQDDSRAAHPIPDSWFAALLLPVIIGCALFAASSQ